MSIGSSTGVGAWRTRILGACAAAAAVLAVNGNVFGSPPRYVEANSGVFAAALLDLSIADWCSEMDASFEPALPEPLATTQEPAIEDPPEEPTKGGGTVCPKVYTICPKVATKCDLTKCPTVKTKCPTDHTKCPKFDTVCPVDPTKCEITKCPDIPTHCPVKPTECEDTKCPPSTTLCPVDPTKCEFTVCPKTTQCGDEKTKCYPPDGPSECDETPGGELVLDETRSVGGRELLVQARVERHVRSLAVTYVPSAL